MSSLLDQSALTDLAERLVAAARRAGADAADALAVRSVSLGVEAVSYTHLTLPTIYSV